MDAAAAAPARSSEPRSWRVLLGQMLEHAHDAVASRMALLALEARRALFLGVRSLVLAVVGALMLFTAWLALLGALVLWAVQAGWSWPFVLVALAVAAVLSAVLSALAARSNLQRIHFDASWRALKGTPSSVAPQDAAATAPQ